MALRQALTAQHVVHWRLAVILLCAETGSGWLTGVSRASVAQTLQDKETPPAQPHLYDGRIRSAALPQRCLTVDTSAPLPDAKSEAAVFVTPCDGAVSTPAAASWLLEADGMMRSPLGLCLSAPGLAACANDASTGSPVAGSAPVVAAACGERSLNFTLGPHMLRGSTEGASGDEAALRFAVVPPAGLPHSLCLCTTGCPVRSGSGGNWLDDCTAGADADGSLATPESWDWPVQGSFLGVRLCSCESAAAAWDMIPADQATRQDIGLAHLAADVGPATVTVAGSSGSQSATVSFGSQKSQLSLPPGRHALKVSFEARPDVTVPDIDVNISVFTDVAHTVALYWQKASEDTDASNWAVKAGVVLDALPAPFCNAASSLPAGATGGGAWKTQSCCPLARVLPAIGRDVRLTVRFRSTDCWNCSWRTFAVFDGTTSLSSTAFPAGHYLPIDNPYCGEVPVELQLETEKLSKGAWQTVGVENVGTVDLGYAGVGTLVAVSSATSEKPGGGVSVQASDSLGIIVDHGSIQPRWAALLVLAAAVSLLAGGRRLAEWMQAKAATAALEAGLEAAEAAVPQPAAASGLNVGGTAPARPSAPVETKPGKGGRVACVDVARGLSLAVMMFVNKDPGFVLFTHSKWNGVQLADSAFPTFSFLMGTSLAIVLRAHERKGTPTAHFLMHVVRRALSLIALGIFWDQAQIDWPSLRMLGVLQYLGVSYFIVASIAILCPRRMGSSMQWLPSLAAPFLCANPERQEPEGSCRDLGAIPELVGFWPEWLAASAVLLVYVVLQTFLPVPGCPTGYIGPGGTFGDGGQWPECTGGAHKYIDMILWGARHNYDGATCKDMYGCGVYDPEGTLGCLTCAFMAFLGLTAGRIIVLYKQPKMRCLHWAAWGAVLIAAALGLRGFSKNDGLIPMNKNLWSISFILFFAGFGNWLLLLFYLLTDVHQVAEFRPLAALGMNSLCVYLLSESFIDTLPQPFPGPTRYATFANSCWYVFLFALFAMFLRRRKIFINL
eukprot:TRINITY_DN36331_c0_g2_i1.p1 TRINITY_DN36331_c0_g2~~TRINITY_DN36331_c0_g2_i1.p1  ORF type:complete len:1010 (-),score=172.99 TRINITY_DN36331_c0_g2_i1:203-3232(-)